MLIWLLQCVALWPPGFPVVIPCAWGFSEFLCPGVLLESKNMQLGDSKLPFISQFPIVCDSGVLSDGLIFSPGYSPAVGTMFPWIVSKFTITLYEL